MNTSTMKSTSIHSWRRRGGTIGSTRIQTTYRPRVLHALWPFVRHSRDSIPAKTTDTRVSKSMLSNFKGSRSRPDLS